jgi:acetyltransferase-like isoleucine patch superfamily enzyme
MSAALTIMRAIRVLLLVIWLWVVPTMLASAAIVALITVPLTIWHWPWFVWVFISPTLYLVWLVSLLYLCAPSARKLAQRFPKPRYANLPQDTKKLTGMGMRGLRYFMVHSLPLVGLLEQSPWGRKLVIRAYGPTSHIGAGSQVFGKVQDPDLVEVGAGAIIGAEAAIAAHAWTALPNGKSVYVTAPVKIGASSTVGAGSIVSYGCTVGENAVIEPMSYLEPFTEVPAGEVWGGQPASFKRKRSRVAQTGVVKDAAR